MPQQALGIGWIIIFIAIFYFMLIRPQQKQRKARQTIDVYKRQAMESRALAAHAQKNLGETASLEELVLEALKLASR